MTKTAKTTPAATTEAAPATTTPTKGGSKKTKSAAAAPVAETPATPTASQGKRQKAQKAEPAPAAAPAAPSADTVGPHGRGAKRDGSSMLDRLGTRLLAESEKLVNTAKRTTDQKLAKRIGKVNERLLSVYEIIAKG